MKTNNEILHRLVHLTNGTCVLALNSMIANLRDNKQFYKKAIKGKSLSDRMIRAVDETKLCLEVQNGLE